MTSISPSTAGRTKRVLVVRYSQTGQLDAVTDSLIAPLKADPSIVIHEERLRPLQEFPYPWPLLRFLDAFPESAHMRPAPLQPLSLTGDEDFDLIILPWQVWYLAPSQPVTAFLQSPVAAKLLRGKPVVSLVACRNMWMTAFEKLRGLLDACDARLIDHVALVDPGPTLATFITTPAWMFTGRKSGWFGLPDAGLSQVQIEGCARFGHALRQSLARDEEQGPGPLLHGLGAVQAESRLFISEKAGTRSFYLWGKLLMAVGKPGSPARRPVLVLYLAFLVVLIVTVVPVSLTLQALARPLTRGWLNKIRAQFEFPSGSATDRCPPT